MTEHDSVLFDDELRLLDVLLEEQDFAVAASPALAGAPLRRSGSHALRLTAALLGIAIVVATAWVAARGTTPSATTSSQDPTRPLRAVPFDPALLPNVVGIRLRYARVITDTGDRFEDPQPIRLEIRDGDAVGVWRQALTRQVGAADVRSAGVYAIELDLGNGTMMTGRANADGRFAFGDVRFLADADLKALLARAIDEARRSGLRARGIATSAGELAQLDPDLHAITSPWLSGAEARSLLSRFRSLESIEFAPLATNGRLRAEVEVRAVIGNDLVLALAEMPTLRDLTVLGTHLHADAVRALARMPELRSLGIGSSPQSIPPRELGELVRRLEVLRVPDGALTDEQLHAISRAPNLRELWLHVDGPSAALAECLLSLPRLQRLSITSNSSVDVSELMTVVARTRVAELQIARAIMAPDGLAPLAGLPVLHTLVLRYVFTPAGGHPDLSPLHQLRHLGIQNESNLRNAAREALPECQVHTDSPAETWISPFDLPAR